MTDVTLHGVPTPGLQQHLAARGWAPAVVEQFQGRTLNTDDVLTAAAGHDPALLVDAINDLAQFLAGYSRTQTLNVAAAIAEALDNQETQ